MLNDCEDAASKYCTHSVARYDLLETRPRRDGSSQTIGTAERLEIYFELGDEAVAQLAFVF